MENDAAKFQRLQAEFNTTPKIENLMSAGSKEDELMKNGKKAFLSNDYTKAITFFSQIQANDQAKLYLGHSYYQSKQYSQAEPIYESLQNVENTDYSNEADWFLVQCYLKKLPEQKEKLLGVLNKITSSQKTHNYKKRALLLKEEL